ncbi:glucosidase II beta subunit-like protein-domain-containing protein [Aspergillus granulosus]|uniref:Glucosidase 2 subunit beta n=1 Tax=Aspergillus granulosus TaxID=176169 RepID=A0ABR4GXU4_9EURO
MRSSLRLLNLEVPSSQRSRTLYVCSVCRHEARPRPFVARQFLRNASDSTPITERVRRKLWGTDNPPGLKDPYGGEGVFEKKFKKGRSAPQESEPAATTEVVEEVVSEDPSYEPATTWEGLQRVGHLGVWSDFPPSKADAYSSFSLNRRLTKPGQLSLAAHQTAVELSLMHTLKKPLTNVCDVVEHEQPVFRLIWNCKIQPKSNNQWDSAVVFPDKETEDALVYIFEQIGGAQEPATEAAPERGENAEVAELEAAEVEDAEYEEAVPKPPTQPFFGYQDVKDKGFLDLPLDDPVTKFAFLKRFSQLTGHYFPDPVIHQISSVQQVIKHVQGELNPKPKKLAEHLVADASLQSLPNVKIFAKKQKPGDRDEELGRKKLIDAELPGMVKPLVIKSVFLNFPSLDSFVKRLFILSFAPANLRRFFFSFSSSKTRAVSMAVAAFLIPLGADGVGVDVLLRLGAATDRSLESVGLEESPFEALVSDVAAVSPVPFFLRFLEPGAFFSECVRPCSASRVERAMSFCLSSSFVGRIVMTLSSDLFAVGLRADAIDFVTWKEELEYRILVVEVSRTVRHNRCPRDVLMTKRIVPQISSSRVINSWPEAFENISAFYSACSALVAAGDDSARPRGVGPEFAKFYKDTTTFSCITHPAIQIPFSAVNDDFCDCPDGSDEPGTAACAHLSGNSPLNVAHRPGHSNDNLKAALPGFYCKNKGHRPSYVSFQRVNDGICDYELCCDGSDEWARVGGKKCDDKCKEIGKEWRKKEENRQKSMTAALKKKRDLLVEAGRQQKEVEDRIQSLTTEIEGKELELKSLQDDLEDIQRKEANKVVKGKKAGKVNVLAELAKGRVDELRNALVEVRKERDEIRSRVQELEDVLSKFKVEYNPNFNDEGVKRAVRSWEDYAARGTVDTILNSARDRDWEAISQPDDEESGINWEQWSSEGDEEPDTVYKLAAYLPPSLVSFIEGRVNDVISFLETSGFLPPKEQPSSTESKAVTQAREAVKAAEKAVGDLKSQLKNQQTDLDTEYGPASIFRALKGVCIQKDAGEYTYEHCFLDQTKQIPKKGGSSARMGKFERIGSVSVDELSETGEIISVQKTSLEYTKGQGCWNGPARSTTVVLECGEENEILKIAEDEKCVYSMKVTTPAVCAGGEEPGNVAPRAKDEL